ncbi:MAG TPA: DUF5336 domain-containing protein [Pseudonocardiaceae bacterium]
MSVPYGAPQAQPPQQPPQQQFGTPGQPQQQFGVPGQPTAGALDLPKILYLVTAGLGVLILFLGFAPLTGSTSFYEGFFFAWVPTLLAIGGLTALPVILPGDTKPGFLPAAISVGAILAVTFSTFATDGDIEAGGVLILIFGWLEAIAAVVAYLAAIGVIKMQPKPAGYSQPGGWNPQSGGFPQPMGQQPGQFGQFGQQPGQAPGQFGAGPQGTQQFNPTTPPGGVGQPGQG